MPYSRARVEQRLRRRVGHLALEPGVDLVLVLHAPAREEGRQRELGIDDEGAAGLPRLLEQREHPRHELLPRVGFLVGAHLGGADDDLSHLSSFFRRRSGAASG